MTKQQQEAIDVLRKIVDVGVEKGIFGNANSVVLAHNALAVVESGLQAPPPPDKKEK